MAPLPKKRHSTRRQGKRRSSIKLNAPLLVRCQQCSMLIVPNIVCPNCGYYKGREVINPTKSAKRDENKTRSKTSKKNSGR